MKDLFERPEKLPEPVKNIVEKYGKKQELDYEDCENFLKELKPLGYKFKYGLDAVPFNLMKVKP
jgi:hypothetical protein